MIPYHGLPASITTLTSQELSYLRHQPVSNPILLHRATCLPMSASTIPHPQILISKPTSGRRVTLPGSNGTGLHINTRRRYPSRAEQAILEARPEQLRHCIQGLEKKFEEHSRPLPATQAASSQENAELKNAFKLPYQQVHKFIVAGDHALPDITSTTSHPITHPGIRHFVARWVA